MHVDERAKDISKERFPGVPSRDLKWEDKKETSQKGLFSGTFLFSPLRLKEFYSDLNRSFDSKSVPIRLFNTGRKMDLLLICSAQI